MSSSGSHAPLTTIFTAPSSCATLWAYSYTEGTATSIRRVPQDATDLGMPFGPDCFPTSFPALASSFYYSPGVCPDGNTVTSATSKGTGGKAHCCPSNYTFNGLDECYSSYTRTTAYRDVRFGASGSFFFSVSPTAPATVGPGVAYVSAIPISWNFSDLPTLPSKAVAQLTAAVPVPVPGNRNGLSTGAIAGIAGGVGFAVLLVVGVVIFLIRKKRCANARENVEDDSGIAELEHTGTGEAVEMEGKNGSEGIMKSEQSISANELDSKPRPQQELDGIQVAKSKTSIEIPGEGAEVFELPALEGASGIIESNQKVFLTNKTPRSLE